MSYLRGSDVAWVKIQDIWYMLKKYLANQSQNLKRMPCNFHVWGIHHKAPTQSLRAGPSESVGNRIFAYFKLGWTIYQLCSIFSCSGQLNNWHCLSLGLSQLTIRAYNHYNHYNHCRDSDLDLDLDWELFSEIVTYWHSWLLLTNCETWIMTLGVSDLKSDNSCDVLELNYTSLLNSTRIWQKAPHAGFENT